jgi:ketosteroid isomerase-like protein
MIGALMARKAVKAAFASLNRRDIAAFLADWRDDATFTFPGNISVSGTKRGKGEIEQWFHHFMEQYPKLEFTVKDLCVRNIFALGGTNVVAARWDIDVVNRTGKQGRNSGVTVIEIEGGKVAAVTDYIFDQGEEFLLNWGEAGA